MKAFLRLSFKSMFNRRLTTGLTLVALALSFTLIMGIEILSKSVRKNFEQTISGTDLIVGTPTHELSLLLALVFRIGTTHNLVSFSAYEHFKDHPAVAWTIPISLGDSFRGFGVVGTDENYYKYFRYNNKKQLRVQGAWSVKELDVVLGATVAHKTGLVIGKTLSISHGLGGQVDFAVSHDGFRFTVVGILEETGTPNDSAVFVTLDGLDKIHEDVGHHHGDEDEHDHEHGLGINGFLVGLKSKMDVFGFREELRNYEGGELLGVIPGMALRDLWSILGNLELALLALSWMVFLVTLMVMLVGLISSLAQRRREMAIYRALGAGPGFVVGMLFFESLVMLGLGLLLGFGIVVGIGLFGGEWFIWETLFDWGFAKVLITILAAGLAVAAVPSWWIYGQSLNDGLQVKE